MSTHSTPPNPVPEDTARVARVAFPNGNTCMRMRDRFVATGGDAGIEGTLSQGIRAFELWRTGYRGLAKTHLQHLATAAAMNLVRVSQWYRV